MNNDVINKMEFFINKYGSLFTCYYSENLGKKIDRLGINLPKDELQALFSKFKFKYRNNLTKGTSGSNTVITFTDLDIDEIDEIIRRSEQYQEDFVNEMRKKEQEQLKKILKIERRKKIKKTAIKVSAEMLAILTLFACSKGISSVMVSADFNPSNEITYPEHKFFQFMNHQNLFPMDETLNSNDNDLNNSENQVIDNVDGEINYSNLPVGTVIGEPVVVETKPTQTEDISQFEEIPQIEEAEIIPDFVFSLDADDCTDEEKYFIANAYYSDAITRTAKTYGIDPQLALAIACHERGLHSEHVDYGGGIGLFQIQIEGGWNWENKNITAYNFDTNSYETVTITKDGVSDVFQNIKVACMMIQDTLIRNNYNLLKAVTEYNYGADYVRQVIERCSSETGFAISELNSMDNYEWLKYRGIISGGDPEYLENVFKYIPDGSILSFTKPTGEQVNIQYNNSNALVRE